MYVNHMSPRNNEASFRFDIYICVQSLLFRHLIKQEIKIRSTALLMNFLETFIVDVTKRGTICC